MTARILLLIALTAGGCTPIAAPERNQVLAAAAACAAVSAAGERLICYDGVHRPAATAVVAVNRPIDARPVRPASPSPAADRADPGTPPAATPVQPSIASIADFGRNEAPPKPQRPREISANVAHVETKWPERLQYTLDNGQVWLQTKTQPVTIYAGDAVTLIRGRLGGYLLVSSRGGSTRVKRVD